MASMTAVEIARQAEPLAPEDQPYLAVGRFIMSQAVLSRQFIRDVSGQPVAVILPIEEYALVRSVLEERDQRLGSMVREMKLAADDALFLADLRESMTAFETADADWWEHET